MIGIYKIENLITHECYIGQSKFIERRWREHKSAYRLNNTNKFYLAIQRYGLENFSFEVIEECAQEELDKREIYWIDYFNSYEQGYNSSKGGQFKTTIPNSEVYAAWDSGKSVKQIAEELKISTSLIYEILNSYENYTPHESKKRGGVLAYQTFLQNQGIDSNNQIFQYSLTGEFIKEWHSAKEIERTLKIDSASVGKALSGEANSAGGYLWSKIYVNKLETIPQISQGIAKSVKQYDLQNNFIQEFKSLSAAARAVHGNSDTSLIRRVLNHKTKTAYGFRWKT